jgi:hypothetical protein
MHASRINTVKKEMRPSMQSSFSRLITAGVDRNKHREKKQRKKHTYESPPPGVGSKDVNYVSGVTLIARTRVGIPAASTSCMSSETFPAKQQSAQAKKQSCE